MPGAKPRILVADDEEGIRESLNLILGEAYELVCTKDGEETLAMLRKEPFDVLLLDLKMPKLDGMDVLKQLHRDGRHPAVLILTAYQSVELAKEAIKLGAQDYLPKPFERDQVLRAVHEALQGAGGTAKSNVV